MKKKLYIGLLIAFSSLVLSSCNKLNISFTTITTNTTPISTTTEINNTTSSTTTTSTSPIATSTTILPTTTTTPVVPTTTTNTTPQTSTTTITQTTTTTSGGSDIEATVDSIQDLNILHTWNWKVNDVKSRLQAIKNAGYGAVQLSPLQVKVDKNNWSTESTKSQWWKLYQPLAYKIAESGESFLGKTKALSINVSTLWGLIKCNAVHAIMCVPSII